MRFIHTSDLHHHRSKSDNTETGGLLMAIKGKYPDHCVVIAGDTTDDGHAEQYKRAVAALQPFI